MVPLGFVEHHSVRNYEIRTYLDDLAKETRIVHLTRLSYQLSKERWSQIKSILSKIKAVF
jgi:hypothetical protein